MNSLLGKTITAVFLATDGSAIKFLTKEKEIIAQAEGDCCSHSWIENVETPENLLGFVINVEDIRFPELNKKLGYGDLLQFYGFKIITDKGSSLLDYRNESNGYYGGSLIWEGDYGFSSKLPKGEYWKQLV